MSDTASTPQGPVLPDKPRSSRTWLWVTIAVVAVAAVVAAVLLIPRLLGAGDAASGDRTTVRLGTTDASQGHWPVLQEILADEGIDLEIVSFDSYETPNPALADGEIDLNAFQHIDYLSDHNVATGDGLAVVGPTLIVPLPIYSAKYDSVEDFPEGARITIPNDPTNQARALKVLQAAGLIVLDEDATTPTPADILSGTVEVEPVDASQTAPSLNDPQIAGAVVNNNFATDAGILDQALFSVDPAQPESWPYINIIASRAGEEDDPVFQKVWEAYHDQRVTDIVVKESGDTAIIVQESPKQVRDWLAEIEAQKKAAR
ncbi:MetQ/NlpA family ABC transporter substrate-binding protein [Microbacterium ulmi]|uniref:Metal ABC transporter substrate-binding protein n=1 Tax=Microbacterium ulmi TaxID=179095 RepID=A0A7Y2LZU4_9MICO|nr:MetQ/NlpA family ABC transporter substrate-binding protein [Microbacterium ulmi]NII68918.1 D-methionine transport system substrate-binding protein [Microbacterium ulmi]NNH03901.1 metal ABC transporter substrate-binding protein [Microbacterium ulmi]